MKLKRWQLWLGLLISAVFLYLALRNVSFSEVWFHLKHANFWWLIPGVMVYFIGVYTRAWRWKLLLDPLKSISAKKIFPIINIGYMGNNIYPARAGEILRSILLKKKFEISISASLATIVVERILDALVIIGFVLLNLGQLSVGIDQANLKNIVNNLAFIGGLVFLFILGLFILMTIYPKQASKIIDWLINKILPQRIRQQVRNIANSFLEGLSSLHSFSSLFLLLLLTALIWTLETVLYWAVMKAMGLQLSFLTLMLLNGVINLVLLVPAAPGGLGTFDAACKTFLEAFGIASELALGYTLILRIVLWLPITLLGAYHFLREGLHWNQDFENMTNDAIDKSF